jgi:hypothetical protein
MSDQTNPSGGMLRAVTTGVLLESGQYLRACLASAVLLALALAVERVFFGPGFYSGLSLHPFWIIILLVTAALAALAMDWPPRGLDSDMTTYLVDMLTLPVLWLVSAFCLGIFRQSELTELQDVRAANAHLQEVNTALAQEILQTDLALERAELAVVTQRDDLAVPTGALTALLDLETADREALPDRVQAAALHFTLMPVDLVLANDSGELCLAPGCSSECGLAYPLTDDAGSLHMAGASGRAIIVKADDHGNPGKFLVLAVIPSEWAGVLAGAIVFCADSAAEAQSLCPVADLLARATFASLTQTPASVETWAFRSGLKSRETASQVTQ